VYSEIIGKKVANSSNKEIYYIDNYKLQDLKNIVICDALILDYTDSKGCTNFLRSIRNSLIESIYLVPVFIFAVDSIVDPLTQILSDGIISSVNDKFVVETIEKISIKRENLGLKESNTFEQRIINKLLRILYTRNISLEPIVNPESHTGYEFPFINGHFNNNQTTAMYDILEGMVETNLLTSTFSDRVKLCNRCYSAFLNYRESCPKCRSYNLSNEKMIYHTECGFMGVEKAFGSQTYKICPNCNKQLWQLGVDYTKPSGMYSCNDCRHLFREPVRMAFCFNCQTENIIDLLHVININTYQLTKEGEKMALGEQNKEKEKILEAKNEVGVAGFISFTTFSTFLDYEIQRIKTTGTPIAIGKIKIDISLNDKTKLGFKFQNLLQEIGEFIKNTTSPSDILTVGPNDVFLIITSDNSMTKLDFLLANLQLSTQKMLSLAFPEVDISARVKSTYIDGSLSKTEIINDLIR
jgi:hypothetical protein